MPLARSSQTEDLLLPMKRSCNYVAELVVALAWTSEGETFVNNLVGPQLLDLHLNVEWSIKGDNG